ncbi:MAG: DUF6448 family protein [Phycisphaerae bacterium]
MLESIVANPAVWTTVLACLGALVLLLRHCDSMGGPVVADARKSLDDGKLARLLKWISAGQEDELKQAFERTLNVRQSGPEARELAEKYFLETAVRLHRAHEGASYTGLKPAEGIPPSVALADKALADGTCDELIDSVTSAVRTGLKEKFEHLHRTRPADEDVDAGRRWTKEYADFVHTVLHISQAVGGLDGRE